MLVRAHLVRCFGVCSCKLEASYLLFFGLIDASRRACCAGLVALSLSVCLPHGVCYPLPAVRSTLGASVHVLSAKLLTYTQA